MTKEEATKYFMNIREAINALKKEFCEDISEDGTLTVNVEDGNKVSRVFVCGDNHFGGLYYPEQELCPDAISRQAALRQAINAHKMAQENGFDFKDICEEYLNVLPPVTLQPKMGRWIESTGQDDIGHFYTCSECGRYINLVCGAKLADYPYCHCGAKMEVDNEEA